MASAAPEKQVDFLLMVMKNCTDFKVDYHGLATDAGINSANNAQKKFKAIVEKDKDGGYKLVSGRVVSTSSATPATPSATTNDNDNGEDDDATTPAPSTPASAKKRKTKKAEPSTPAGKRARKGGRFTARATGESSPAEHEDDQNGSSGAANEGDDED